MLTLTFTAFCDDSGHFALDDRDQFRLEVAQHFKGEELAVSVTKKRKQRTHAQLRWLFGVAYPLIAEHCGYDRHELEDLHDDVLAVRFGTVTKAALVPGAPDRTVPAKRTRELNTTEMSDFIDWLPRWASTTFGVVIPLPNEPISEVA